MLDCVAFLGGLAGRWEGAGVNHEGQDYRGEIIFEPPVNGSAIILHFVALGAEGAVYHRETLMVGVDGTGACVAFSASSNLPGIVRFMVMQPDAESVVFTLGDRDDLAGFREVITIRREANGGIFHGFAWGMPGEPVRERSSARLVFVGT